MTRGRRRRRRVPFVQQLGPTECGLACLTMVARYHGIRVTQEELGDRIGVDKDGASAAGIIALASELGLQGTGLSLEVVDLRRLPKAAILHWQFRHYVVLERARASSIDIVDPSSGPRRVSEAECRRSFTGVALVFEPGPDVRGEADVHGWRARLVHLRPMLGELRDLAVTVGGSMLVQLLALTIPFFVGNLVDHVLPWHDDATFTVLLGAAGVGVVLALLAQLVRGFASANLRARLSILMGRRFVSHLLSLPFAFFERRPAGDLIDRIRSNSAIREIVSGAAVSALLDGSFVLLYACVLLAASPGMALAAGALAGLEATFYLASWRRRRELIAAKLREAAAMNATEVEMFGAIESLKGLGLEATALARWGRTQRAEVGATLQLGRVDVLVSSARSALALASPLVMLGVGAHQVLAGTLSVGMMLALNALAMSLLSPLSGLFAAASQLQTVAGHLERIDDILARAPEGQGGRPVPDGTQDIRLTNVSYRHGSAGLPAVDDVSLVIPKGTTVALVGASGAGKTTLARLIAGLYEPQTGTIHDGDVPRAELGAAAFRQRAGYVPQEARLFGPTIRSELGLARPNASMAEIVRAATSVGIHAEIMQMTLQYATPIVDGSVGLSGGQRQRIALARAILREPPLLVLDEATSALDAHAEAIVYACVSRLQCTRVIVAHRLSTVRNADLVVVLDRGRVVELGHPSELEAAHGAYARLMAGQTRVVASEQGRVCG